MAVGGERGQGALCDILWSDPIGPNLEDEAWEGAKRDTVTFVPNWDRGAGHFYGIAAVRDFVARNKLDGVIRAHEVRGPGRVRERCKGLRAGKATHPCRKQQNGPAHEPLGGANAGRRTRVRWKMVCTTITATRSPSILWCGQR